MTEPSPTESLAIIGHAAPEAHLAKLFHENHLPHALLLTGPKGIGKSKLAFRLARFLLAQGSKPVPASGLMFDLPPIASTDLSLAADHPIIRRVAASSHPDFLLLRPEFDEKKKEFKAEIPVEETRRVSDFMALTPAESAWRVAVIDSVDELNRNAANALLKVLEEPPQKAILILISHNPARLLPTIRSRCQVLALSPPSMPEFSTILKGQGAALEEEEMQALALLSDRSPGRALLLHDMHATAAYGALVELAGQYPPASPAQVQVFLDAYVKKDGNQHWQVLGWLFDLLLTRVQKAKAGLLPEQEIVTGEKTALTHLAAMRSLPEWFALWEKAGAAWSDTSRLYLDKRLVVQQFLFDLATPTQQAA